MSLGERWHHEQNYPEHRKELDARIWSLLRDVQPALLSSTHHNDCTTFAIVNDFDIPQREWSRVSGRNA